MKISDYCRTSFILLAFTSFNSAHAHGGGGWGGRGHHGGFHHGWGYSSIYISGIGMGYDPYGYPYGPYDYYPYRPYAYPPVVVTVPTVPPIYVQQQAVPAVTHERPVGYWYYCAKPSGYYPHIKECPSGWQQVAPTTSDKQEERK